MSIIQNKIFDKLLPFFEEDEISFLKRIHRHVFKPHVNLPVLYAGSGADIEHALLLGRELVFFESHLPNENTSEIIFKINKMGSVREICRADERKLIVDFNIAGVDFRVTYYAEDATTIGKENYPELERGIYAYFVKVPFPKEDRVGSLRDPEFFGKILGKIKVGGFYLERECPLTLKIPPEDIGFEKIDSGHISALSIHKNAVSNLYRKVREVANLQRLIKEVSFI